MTVLCPEGYLSTTIRTLDNFTSSLPDFQASYLLVVFNGTCHVIAEVLNWDGQGPVHLSSVPNPKFRVWNRYRTWLITEALNWTRPIQFRYSSIFKSICSLQRWFSSRQWRCPLKCVRLITGASCWLYAVVASRTRVCPSSGTIWRALQIFLSLRQVYVRIMSSIYAKHKRGVMERFLCNLLFHSVPFFRLKFFSGLLLSLYAWTLLAFRCSLDKSLFDTIKSMISSGNARRCELTVGFFLGTTTFGLEF